MNIIKSVLRLMSAIALTTVSTSSVIACDNQDFEEMDGLHFIGH